MKDFYNEELAQQVRAEAIKALANIEPKRRFIFFGPFVRKRRSTHLDGIFGKETVVLRSYGNTPAEDSPKIIIKSDHEVGHLELIKTPTHDFTRKHYSPYFRVFCAIASSGGPVSNTPFNHDFRISLEKLRAFQEPTS